MDSEAHRQHPSSRFLCAECANNLWLAHSEKAMLGGGPLNFQCPCFMIRCECPRKANVFLTSPFSTPDHALVHKLNEMKKRKP